MADSVSDAREVSSITSSKTRKSLSTEFRGEPDGCVASGTSSSTLTGPLAETEGVGPDHAVRAPGDTTLHGAHAPLGPGEDPMYAGAKGRPYSLYDFGGKKFYTLSEASLRSSKSHFPHHNVPHPDITKCNSIGKCNSVVVEVAKNGQFVRGPNSRPNTAYSHIEKFNRTLESEGIYMRNTNVRSSSTDNDHNNKTSSKNVNSSIRCSNGNGSIVSVAETSSSTYGTIPRVGNMTSAERIYGGGVGGGFVVDMAAVERGGTIAANGGVGGPRPGDELHNVGTSVKDGSGNSKAGRLKRVRRTGLLGLKMGRFTKNSAKKNSTKNNDSVMVESASPHNVTESPPPYQADNVVMNNSLQSRAASLDHLNFEEKRKLIASSLSLSEMLSADSSTKPAKPGGGNGGDGEEDREDNKNYTRKEGEDIPDSGAGRRWEKLGGIGLVGMGNSNNSSPRPAPHSRHNLVTRPSTPSPLIYASASEASIPVRPASVCGINSTGYNNDNSSSVMVLLNSNYGTHQPRLAPDNRLADNRYSSDTHHTDNPQPADTHHSDGRYGDHHRAGDNRPTLGDTRRQLSVDLGSISGTQTTKGEVATHHVFGNPISGNTRAASLSLSDLLAASSTGIVAS